MNNESVAWMVKAPDGEYLIFKQSDHPVMADCTYIPLYTHPVKTQEPDCYGDGNVYRGVRSKDSEIQTIHIDSTAKTLTDEEITKLWCEVYNFKGYDCLTELDFKFCREIIRKAQDK